MTVFVYARPGHARNCWELAEAALHELKARFGTGVRIITAGSWATPDDLGGGIEHLGFLDYADTGRLYRTCDVGLSLQVSEHPSYLPLELLACGVPVVAFGIDPVREVSDDGRGFTEDTRSGVGLYSMHERAAELSGTCTIITMPGKMNCW